MYCILIHSPAGGHLGYFHVLAIVNSAAVKLGYMSILQLWLPQSICPIMGLVGHMVVLFSVFKGISLLFSIVAVSIYIPTNNARGFPFLHTLPAFVACGFFF